MVIPAAPLADFLTLWGLLVYLQATEEVPRRHEFEWLLPGGRDTIFLRVDLRGVEPPLEKQQHAVHDPHDEVRRAAERPHSSNVRWLDGLKERRSRGKKKLCRCFVLCLKVHEHSENRDVFVTRHRLSHTWTMEVINSLKGALLDSTPPNFQ